MGANPSSHNITREEYNELRLTSSRNPFGTMSATGFANKNDNITKMTSIRGYIIDFLVFGIEDGIPDKFIKRLTQLEKACDNGDIKALLEILNRTAGKAQQNVELTVSNKKMITDDTKRLPPSDATPLEKANYRVLEASKPTEDKPPATS